MKQMEKVFGVEIIIEGETKTITSDAVVVTTGGYGSNHEMIESFRPDLKGYVSTNGCK